MGLLGIIGLPAAENHTVETLLDVGRPVARDAVNPEIQSMGTTHVDISRLTVDQRLQLVEELWDSLSPVDVPLTPAQERELDRREALHRGHPGRGRPWREALDEIQRRGG